MSKIFKKVERSYQAGQVIFQQGDASDGIYSVKVGKVSVYKTKATAAGPAEIEIVQLGVGSMFGEMGMLDNTARDASVKALEYTECLVITSEMFENQMEKLPPWVANFIKILIGRLRVTNDKLLTAMHQLEAKGLSPADKGESRESTDRAIAQGAALAAEAKSVLDKSAPLPFPTAPGPLTSAKPNIPKSA